MTGARHGPVDGLVVLHVSPHPDDAALGAPLTLQLLQQAGAHVVDLLVSRGRPGDRERRLAEAREASRRAGLHLEAVEPPVALSAADDLDAARTRVAGEVAAALARTGAGLVLSPTHGDRHHGHEVVGRGVGDALTAAADPPAWWTWSLWGELPFPDRYVAGDDAALSRAEHALAAYGGELARNGYDRLLRARGTACAVLGAERVFGFGSAAASALPYADLLTGLRRVGGRWHGSPPALLEAPQDVGPALTATGTGPDLDAWVRAPTARELRAAGGGR